MNDEVEDVKVVNCEDLEPDPNCDYFYTHDMAWSSQIDGGCLEDEKLVGKELQFVKYENDRYVFQFKDSDFVFHTHYSWSFAIDTPDNRDAFRKYQDIQSEICELHKVRDLLYSKVKSLKHK